MKNTIFILSTLLLFAFSSIGQSVQQGQYDETINSLVAKLKKKPGKTSAALQLDSLFRLANEQDVNLITNLKLSGQPDIWHEVYNSYQNLDVRQESIDALAPEVKAQIGFTFFDYQSFLNESLVKACDYYYALAQKDLKSGNTDDPTKVLEYLQEIDTLKPDYKDVRTLLAKYEKVEPVVVYFEVKNKYPNELPSSMEGAIESIDLSAYNKDGLTFVYTKPKDKGYEYFVELKVTEILLSPEKTDELYYTESADIQDGVAYKVNENGDLLYDSNGNKIEILKYKTIACYVTELIQHKSMMVRGTVEIIERKSGKTITEKQISGETKFRHRSAKFKGDLNALMPETLELIGSRELQYPTDLMMIIQANEILGKNAADVVEQEIKKY